MREPGSEERIWWGDVNQETSEEHFEGLRDKVADYLGTQDLYVVNAFAGADPEHRIAVRVITYSPWHALFAKTLFIDPSEEELEEFEPTALVLHAPAVEADPAEDGTRGATFVVVHPTRGEVVIGGTHYAGEIKKSVFTYELPAAAATASSRCTARRTSADDGNVALFFGLSGTGKTTLSADPDTPPDRRRRARLDRRRRLQLRRRLLRQVIRLSPRPSRRSSRRLHLRHDSGKRGRRRAHADLDDDPPTENTRGAYPIDHIARAALPSAPGIRSRSSS